MKALILAAGYATRLYPLTKEYPKALLTVEHKPIIDYVVEKLNVAKEINEIIVVTNSKFFSRFKKWKLKQKGIKHISILDDLTTDNKNRRGAIGDIDFAIDKKNIREDLLVVGGDNLFDDCLDGFLGFVRMKNGSPVIGIHKLKDKSHADRFGVVRLNRQGRVIDFEEKPRNPKSTLVAMCLYYFPRKTLALVKEYLSRKAGRHDATGVYIDWLRDKLPVFGFVFGKRWYDIGDHKFYNQARESFAKLRRRHVCA
jgi:glucose-1-phosphate thymidylyltransferase